MQLPPNFLQTYGPWALVTGASSGIGAEFARQLAAAGVSIVLTARRTDRLQALSDQLSNNFPVQTRVITADLSTPEGWKSIITETEDLQIGLLVASAGFETHGSFFRTPITRYAEMISVHCTAVTALSHTFGKKMARAGRGGIILVSSVAVLPTPWWATYSATKGFISNLGLCLRDELQRLGVDVMVLEPGVVKSEMSDSVGRTLNFRKMGLSQQPTDQCVSQALQSFIDGHARTTPGLANRIFYFTLRILPTTWAIRLFSFALGNAMDQSVMRF